MTTITGHTTRANGTILTAAIYNFDHVNHIGNANNLNNDKIEGATPPVVDGHAVVFNGTSGAEIRTAGGPPLLTSVLPLSPANGGTGQITLGAAAASFAANGAGFGPLTTIAAAATVDLGTAPSHNVLISGSAVSVTSFGSSANVATPLYRVQFLTGPVTLVNSANLILPGNNGVLDFRAEDSFIASYQGAGVWRIIDVIQEQFSNNAGFVNGVNIFNNGANPNTQLDISWASTWLIGPFGHGYSGAAGAGTLNAAVVGAGGLDAGALAANTWYYVWLISTGNNTTALLSLSSTGPTMPAGYVYKYRIGAVRTSGASQLLRISQRGNQAQYRVIGGTNTPNLPVIGTGVAGSPTVPTWVSIGLGAVVPPTAIRVKGGINMVNSTSIITAAPNNQHGGTGSLTNPPPVYLTARGGTPFDFLLETQEVFWACNDATGIIWIQGWTDSVICG